MNNDSALTREMAIQEQLQQALMANKATAPYPIEVAVQGATVSLLGTVESQGTKGTAEQVARSVPGVVEVINELIIDKDAGKGGGWLGGARGTGGTEGDVEAPPVVGAAGLATRGGAGAGQGGVGTGGVPLAAAELAGATEDVQREAEPSGEEPGS